MTDCELSALAVMVQVAAMQCRSFDEGRLARGLALGYGDMAVEGQAELEEELRRRGILKGTKK